MACAVTLRQSGGAIILSIPKSIARTMAVEAGSVVELVVQGRKLSVTPARLSLADRLAMSPRSPAAWRRDDDWETNGAECLIAGAWPVRGAE